MYKLNKSIIISTDSEEIAAIVNKITGVKVHWRPNSLADDFTPTVPVIREAIISNKLDDGEPICCIYPVNPFLNNKDLSHGIELLLKNPTISYVNSICSYPYPIQRAIRQNSSGRIEMIDPEMALTRSQDLEEYFHDAGQWYWGLASTWKNEDKLLFNSIGLRIPRWRCQDIDTLEDWESSEKLYLASKLEG